MTVQEDYQDWRKIKGIQLEGRVELVDGVAAKAKAMAVYALKYPEVIKLFTDPTSGVFHKAFLKVKFYCVVPEKLFFIDNEQGFGKRQELLFDRSTNPARKRLKDMEASMSQLLGKELPAALQQRLSGDEVEAHEGKIIPIFTIDDVRLASSSAAFVL